MPEITSLHLPVEDLADEIVTLVETSYPDMSWNKTEQALDWARHLLKIRSHSYVAPPPPEPPPEGAARSPAGRGD